MIRRSAVAGTVIALLACGSAFGQAVPKEMTWTAYDAGSSGFNLAVAIGQQFKLAYGAEVRILPSGSDTGRLAPVRANRAVISQMGTGIYYAQEGVFEFGSQSWGPQAVRLLMSATACNGLGLGVARYRRQGDQGLKERVGESSDHRLTQARWLCSPSPAPTEERDAARSVAQRDGRPRQQRSRAAFS